MQVIEDIVLRLTNNKTATISQTRHCLDRILRDCQKRDKRLALHDNKRARKANFWLEKAKLAQVRKVEVTTRVNNGIDDIGLEQLYVVTQQLYNIIKQEIGTNFPLLMKDVWIGLLEAIKNKDRTVNYAALTTAITYLLIAFGGCGIDGDLSKQDKSLGNSTEDYFGQGQTEYFQNNDYVSALRYFQLAESLHDKSDGDFKLVEILARQASCYFKINDHKSGWEIFSQKIQPIIDSQSNFLAENKNITKQQIYLEVIKMQKPIHEVFEEFGKILFENAQMYDTPETKREYLLQALDFYNKSIEIYAKERGMFIDNGIELPGNNHLGQFKGISIREISAIAWHTRITRYLQDGGYNIETDGTGDITGQIDDNLHKVIELYEILLEESETIFSKGDYKTIVKRFSERRAFEEDDLKSGISRFITNRAISIIKAKPSDMSLQDYIETQQSPEFMSLIQNIDLTPTEVDSLLNIIYTQPNHSLSMFFDFLLKNIQDITDITDMEDGSLESIIGYMAEKYFELEANKSIEYRIHLGRRIISDIYGSLSESRLQRIGDYTSYGYTHEASQQLPIVEGYKLKYSRIVSDASLSLVKGNLLVSQNKHTDALGVYISGVVDYEDINLENSIDWYTQRNLISQIISTIEYTSLGLEEKIELLFKYKDYENKIMHLINEIKEKNIGNIMDMNKQVVEINTQLLDQQIQLLQKEAQQTISNYLIISGIIVSLGLAGFAWYKFNQNKIITELLSQEKILRKQIEEHLRNSKDSIQYASLIQRAFLPSADDVSGIFPNNFILYRPKDIVSGDFYDCLQLGKYKIFLTADCTGHGVPGAFLHMILYQIFRQIIQKFYANDKITEVSDIFKNISAELTKVLQKNSGDRQLGPKNNGMDAVLVVFDEETSSLYFVGANNPLFVFSSLKLTEHKGTKLAIGQPINYTKILNFETKKIEVNEGDIIYMFSDGFTDQFGGLKNRKFLIRHFRELLIKIHKLPLAKQEKILIQELNSRQGNEPQTDDITVVGIRF